jgi:cob(I)alamin adenosyltransferase
MKIYTRTGDDGSTALVGGTRTAKSDSRVDAYGDVDETNALVGLARSEGLDSDIDVILETVQRDLFALGSRLADPGGQAAGRATRNDVGPDAVAQLEEWIDAIDAELPSLSRFILPGGNRAAAALHVARTVCRRAERRMVALDSVEPGFLAYINRLSDLLFVVARVVNRRADIPEVEW